MIAIGAFSAMAFGQAELGTETVVVTGIRASMASAQAIKQSSDQVVDTITAVDIGALPDRNVADALQRIPGVTLQRTDSNRDPVRYGGTGNGVYIRGLAWVQSLTNGRDEFSAANGRSLSFADVSADLLSAVSIYKNPDAEMIEGGVGGTVDLKTRKPLDQEGMLLAGSADFTYGDLIDRGTVSGNALFSDRFSTSIGEIGILISADYQDQRNRTNGVALSHYDCVDSTGAVGGQFLFGSSQCGSIAAGAQRYIPNIFGARQIDWQQKRFATDNSVQWRPNEQWEITLEGFYSKADPHDEEYTLPFNVPQGLPNSNVSYNFDAANVWTGGTVQNAQTGGIDTRVGKHEDFNGDYSLNVKFNPNDSWSFSADVQYLETRATNYSMTGFVDMGNPNDSATPGVPGENFMLDLTKDPPSWSVSNPGALAVSSNSYYAAAMDHLEDNFAHAWSYRADGVYNVHEENGWIKSVDFGFRGEDRQAITRQTGYNWSLLSHQSWGGGPPVFLNQTGFPGGTPEPKLPDTVALHDFGSFFGGAGPKAWFFKPSFLETGTQDVYSVVKATEDIAVAGFGWSPYATQSGCPAHQDVKCLAIYGNFTPRADNISAGINNQHEKTYAGYLQVNYGHDDFLGTGVPVDGNFGVRIVHTQDETAAGKLALPTFSSACAPSPTTDCTDFNNAVTFTGAGGTLTMPAVSNSYTDYLPSFNFRAHISDQLQARLAFSQGIVRPDFTYTQNYATLGFTFGPTQAPPLPNLSGTFFGPAPLNGTGGNPNLKPMHANNYDASLEWYFSPSGNVTFALFHKDLTNYVLTGPVPLTMTRNGITYTFAVTSYVNGSKGKVEGFELGYQQFYDSLPGFLGGFGLAVNYTKIYNSGGSNPTVNLFETVEIGNAKQPLPLEGMSPDSYNLQLMYEKYGISARLAYNWRSRFLLTSSAANVNQPVWSENYGQLDGSVFYTIMDHYKIGIQATNIMKSETILDAGYTDFHPRYDWIETDRKISLILRGQW